MENKQLYLPKSELSFLIADDEPFLIDFNVLLFKVHYKNCRLTTCINGEELIKHASANRYDFIITDYRMPIINGLEAIKTIRKNGNQTRVAITTGTPDENICRYADNPVNLVSLFEKPFQFEELKSEINKYLNL